MLDATVDSYRKIYYSYRKIYYLGLGVVSATRRGVADLDVRELIEEGKRAHAEDGLLEQHWERLETELEESRTRLVDDRTGIEKLIGDTLYRYGFPSRDAILKATIRIEKLTARVSRLYAKQKELEGHAKASRKVGKAA